MGLKKVWIPCRIVHYRLAAENEPSISKIKILGSPSFH
jgi:hypothetical protein